MTSLTNQQILEQAIQKAIDGGWTILEKYEANKFDVQKNVFDGNYMIGFLANDEPTGREILQQTFHWSEIIFNHDFAKALWGDKEHKKILAKHKAKLGKGYPVPRPPQYVDWQLHLMRMVIADDPIDYMYREVVGEEKQ